MADVKKVKKPMIKKSTAQEWWLGATSQYLDADGKCRMLNFSLEKVSLMSSPLPPFPSLPVVDHSNIIEGDITHATAFLKKRKWQIISQDGNENEIQGLWVLPLETDIAISEKTTLYYAYVPLETTPFLDNKPPIPLASLTQNDPLRTEMSSELAIHRKGKQLAQYLRQYLYHLYAIKPFDFASSIDEMTVQMNNLMVVKPDHIYDLDILKKRFVSPSDPLGRQMYEKNKLIVPSKKIQKDLYYALKIAVLNDRPGMLALADKKSLEGVYLSLDDFQSGNDEIVFLSKFAIQKWKEEVDNAKYTRMVSDVWLVDRIEPYFYRSPKIRANALMIVQNTSFSEDEEERKKLAIAIAWFWRKERVNYGRAIVDKDINLVEPSTIKVYDMTGDHQIEAYSTKKGAGIEVGIVRYAKDDYGAMLFL